LQNSDRKGVFIDLKTDFAFKRMFGSEENKDLLIDFLNEVFKGEFKFSDIVYNDKEQVGRRNYKSVVYDIYCTTDTGDRVIVEMQYARTADFINRTVFYVARSMVRQGHKGEDYDMSRIDGVFIMNDFV